MFSWKVTTKLLTEEAMTLGPDGLVDTMCGGLVPSVLKSQLLTAVLGMPGKLMLNQFFSALLSTSTVKERPLSSGGENGTVTDLPLMIS
jgi:hypothetical protein